jgi:hypothetical protein
MLTSSHPVTDWQGSGLVNVENGDAFTNTYYSNGAGASTVTNAADYLSSIEDVKI